MSSIINTNMNTLTAQRNLATNQASLATSMQRLSSGLRINSAKDDAAGLAIATRFTTQVNGLNQAARNANDGISLAQTGEGALGEVTNNLQRIRELAVQAANVTNSSSDRAAIDLEVQQRLAEIDRSASQTSFNGQKILNGEMKTASFQVGANVGDTISVGLNTSVRLDSLGSAASAISGATMASLIAGAGSPAVPGSYTLAAVTGGFDFTNTGAAKATFTSGAVTPTNYSSVAPTQAQITSGAVASADYRDIAAKFSSVQSSAILSVDYSNIIAKASTATSSSINSVDYSSKVATEATYRSGSITFADYSSKAATKGTSVQAGALVAVDTTSLDVSFTVDGAGNTVTLTGKNYTLGTPGSDKAQMVTDIQASLEGTAAGTYNVSLDGSGKLQIQKVGTGTAAPVVATVADATLGQTNAAGIVNGAGTTAGAATDNTPNKTFDIQGVDGTKQTFVLSSNIDTMANLLTALTTGVNTGKLALAHVSASNDSGRLLLTDTTTGVGNITVTGPDATLITAGNTDIAGKNIDNSANKTFTIQGVGGSAETFTLTSNITSAADMMDALDAGDNNGKLDLAKVDVAVAGGKLVFTSQNTGPTQIAFGGTDQAILDNAGTGFVSTPGTTISSAPNKTFTLLGVGGVTQTFDLTSNITNVADMITALGAGTNSGKLALAKVALTNDNNGHLVITATNSGTTPVTIGGTDHGILDTVATGYLATPGAALDETHNKTFTIGGAGATAQTFTLTGVITDTDSMVAALTGGTNAAAYAASGVEITNDGSNHLLIKSTNAGIGQVSISGTDAAILNTGSGYAKVDGLAQNDSANKTFTIAGPGGSAQSFTLSTQINTAADMVSALKGLTGSVANRAANAAAYLASGLVATDAGGGSERVLLTAGAAGDGSITVTGGAPAAILNTGSTPVAGAAASDKRAGFSVDGHAVALTADYTGDTAQDDLVTAIQNQLNTVDVGAANGKYLVTASGGSGFKISEVTAGAANPVLINAYSGNGLADFGGGASVLGTGLVSGATLTLGAGDLTIQVGSSPAVTITGAFDTTAKLVDAINSNVQGVYASVDGNDKLALTSSQDITLGGTNAAATELAFGATAHVASGSLANALGTGANANTLTVAASNDLIQRVDSALSTVSTMRSTFGAIQNRFDSVIASLSTASENATGARSRIQDADFAAETANLSRSQILQQAGTAMVAQANQLPQGVLALLR